jgi:pimeloyl-ACP methyl ester carboxylesterase
MQYETIDEIAEAIVNDAPDKFALAGLSMGGYIALEVCRKYPDRVEKLALLNTSARTDTPDRTAGRNQAIGFAQNGKFMKAVEIFVSALFHPSRKARV